MLACEVLWSSSSYSSIPPTCPNTRARQPPTWYALPASANQAWYQGPTWPALCSSNQAKSGQNLRCLQSSQA